MSEVCSVIPSLIPDLDNLKLLTFFLSRADYKFVNFIDLFKKQALHSIDFYLLFLF